jgi:outer membrane lipoprotein-sorting protein
MTPPNAARPDAAQPSAARSDAARPIAARPDAAQPNAARSDAARPIAARPIAARPDAAQPNAAELIQQAMDHWRGTTSNGEMRMTIHRPDWERSMTMLIWTQGDETSLVRVKEPARDAGNGTLMKERNMWTFSPKVNRIIKVPSSMMSQSWMGSDFSNKDVSRSTDILRDYDHRLLEVRENDGHQVYVVESVPHEDAAVVWGRQVIHIRDDYILLEEQYWDQDDILVKTLKAGEIREMSGRTVATVMRMSKEEEPGEWTQLETLAIEFDLELPDQLFTLSYLRNPRW